MSYLGKVYKQENAENIEEFAKALQLSDEIAKRLISFSASIKLELKDDTYTLSVLNSDTKDVVKKLVFQNGVEFEDKLTEEQTAKTTITVNGNVIIQKESLGDGKVVIYKKEYNGYKLVETITASFWDGVAKRYYNVE